MLALPAASHNAGIAESANGRSALQRAAQTRSRSGGFAAEWTSTLGPSPQGSVGLLRNEHGRPEQDTRLAGSGAGGGRPGIAWSFGGIPVFSPERMGGAQPPVPGSATGRTGPVQPRLRLGLADDALEHEADRVADQVMLASASSGATIAAAPQISRKRAACRESEGSHEPAGPSALAGEASGIVHDALRSPGQPLDAATRDFFEPRLGHSLSAVRVHTGSAAERSARDMNAVAYTVGQDVMFGAGQFAPGTRAGRRLIAHELAHVVQQDGGEGLVVQRQLIYGAGYPSPYVDDAQEIASFKAGTWSPSSVDFAATVRLSGGGAGVTTLDGLFTELQGTGPNSITNLGLVGHGGSGGFGLSGSITVSPHAVGFDDTGLLTSETLEALSRKLRFVRDRFAEGAVITLYSCSSGTDTAFLDNLSHAFGVCVRGFKNVTHFCIGSDAAGTIVSRGRTRIDAGPQGPGTGCADFQQDIRSLTPDAKSCVGAPVKSEEAGASQ